MKIFNKNELSPRAGRGSWAAKLNHRREQTCMGDPHELCVAVDPGGPAWVRLQQRIRLLIFAWGASEDKRYKQNHNQDQNKKPPASVVWNSFNLFVDLSSRYIVRLGNDMQIQLGKSCPAMEMLHVTHGGDICTYGCMPLQTKPKTTSRGQQKLWNKLIPRRRAEGIRRGKLSRRSEGSRKGTSKWGEWCTIGDLRVDALICSSIFTSMQTCINSRCNL